MEREGDNPEVGATGPDSNNATSEEKNIESEYGRPPDEANLIGSKMELLGKTKEGSMEAEADFEEIGEKKCPELDLDKSTDDFGQELFGLSNEDFPKKKRKRNRKKKQAPSVAEQNDEFIINAAEVDKEAVQSDETSKLGLAVEKNNIDSPVDGENSEESTSVMIETQEENVDPCRTPSKQNVNVLGSKFIDSPEPYPLMENVESLIPEEGSKISNNEGYSENEIIVAEKYDFAQELEEKLIKLVETSETSDPLYKTESESNKSLLIPVTPHTSFQNIPDLEEHEDIIGFFENINLWKKNNPDLLKSIQSTIDQLILRAIELVEKNMLENHKEGAEPEIALSSSKNDASEVSKLSEYGLGTGSKIEDSNSNLLEEEKLQDFTNDTSVSAPVENELETLYFPCLLEAAAKADADYRYLEHDFDYTGCYSTSVAELPKKAKEEDGFQKQVFNSFDKFAPRETRSTTKAKPRRRRSLSRRLSDAVRNVIPCIRRSSSTSHNSSQFESETAYLEPNTGHRLGQPNQRNYTLPKIMKR